LFSYGEGIVDFNSEIPDGALDLRMSQQQLHGSKALVAALRASLALQASNPPRRLRAAVGFLRQKRRAMSGTRSDRRVCSDIGRFLISSEAVMNSKRAASRDS